MMMLIELRKLCCCTCPGRYFSSPPRALKKSLLTKFSISCKLNKKILRFWKLRLEKRFILLFVILVKLFSVSKPLDKLFSIRFAVRTLLSSCPVCTLPTEAKFWNWVVATLYSQPSFQNKTFTIVVKYRTKTQMKNL